MGKLCEKRFNKKTCFSLKMPGFGFSNNKPQGAVQDFPEVGKLPASADVCKTGTCTGARQACP